MKNDVETVIGGEQGLPELHHPRGPAFDVATGNICSRGYTCSRARRPASPSSAELLICPRRLQAAQDTIVGSWQAKSRARLRAALTKDRHPVCLCSELRFQRLRVAPFSQYLRRSVHLAAWLPCVRMPATARRRSRTARISPMWCVELPVHAAAQRVAAQTVSEMQQAAARASPRS